MPLIPAQEAEISMSEFKASLLHREFQETTKSASKKQTKTKNKAGK